MVPGLEQSIVNQARDKTLSVCYYRRQICGTKVDSNTERKVYWRLNGFFAVDDFYDLMAIAWNNAYVIDVLVLGFHLNRKP